MKFISVDVEANGPIPGDYSMICFGAVVVEPELNRTFYGRVRPVNLNCVPEALEISGFTMDQTMEFDLPDLIIPKFYKWLLEIKKTVPIIFISDNPAFDWQFINYYLWHFCKGNPFGHSARRIGDLYCGLVKKINANKNWKRKYRKTRHDHSPLNDAIGNAEAIMTIFDIHGIALQ